jgi:hypothetical protein
LGALLMALGAGIAIVGKRYQRQTSVNMAKVEVAQA